MSSDQSPCPPSYLKMTGRIIRAARALAGVGPEHFAKASGLPVETLMRIEAGGSAWVQDAEEIRALKRALDHFGVLVLAETESLGGGVRLNFTRQDVRQLTRLEGEGGVVGSDDHP